MKFYCNFYSIKGKVVDITTTTGMGLEEDVAFAKHEKYIAEEINKILSKAKEVTGNKKKIFLCEIEDGNWNESKEIFKTPPTITFIPMKLSAADFKWMDKIRDSFDEKDSLTANPAHVEFILGTMS